MLDGSVPCSTNVKVLVWNRYGSTSCEQLSGEVEKQLHTNWTQMNLGRSEPFWEQTEFACGETWVVAPTWQLGPSQRRSFPILTGSCRISRWSYVRSSYDERDTQMWLWKEDGLLAHWASGFSSTWLQTTWNMTMSHNLTMWHYKRSLRFEPFRMDAGVWIILTISARFWGHHLIW